MDLPLLESIRRKDNNGVHVYDPAESRLEPVTEVARGTTNPGGKTR